MSGMSSRRDPIKVTLGVLVLILAGVAGYLGYKYSSQCAGTNGVSCTSTGVTLEEGGVCTADVKSCGSGTADENGVCQFSASSGSSGSGGLGQTNIILIAVAGVLLLVGGSIALNRASRANVARQRAALGVPDTLTLPEYVSAHPGTPRSFGLSAAVRAETVNRGLNRAGSKARRGLSAVGSRVGSAFGRTESGRAPGRAGLAFPEGRSIAHRWSA